MKRPVHATSLRQHNVVGVWGTGIKSNDVTLGLNAPSDASPLLPLKILVLQDISFLVREAFDVCKNLPLKCVGNNVVWYARVDRDGHERVQGWPSYNREARHYGLR